MQASASGRRQAANRARRATSTRPSLSSLSSTCRACRALPPCVVCRRVLLQSQLGDGRPALPLVPPLVPRASCLGRVDAHPRAMSGRAHAERSGRGVRWHPRGGRTSQLWQLRTGREGLLCIGCGLAGSGWNLSGPAGWPTEKIWLHRVRVRLGVRLGLGSGLGSGSGLGLGLGLRLGCKKAEKTESIRGVPIRIPVPLPPIVSGFYQVADRSRALPPAGWSVGDVGGPRGGVGALLRTTTV